MWKTVSEIAKTFLDKHLMPTMISAVSALVLFLILPSDNWMIVKLGKILFLVLLFSIVFLLVHFINYVYRLIKVGLTHSINKIKEKQEMDEHTDELTDVWFTYVDKLPPEDRKLIMRFIENENQPIVERGYMVINSNSIRNTDKIVSTVHADGSREFKLDEKFYRGIKSIYERCGKISHFE